MNIYFDIETIPAQKESDIAYLREESDREIAAIKAPSNYKDEVKIAEYIAAKRVEVEASFDDRYRKTSFDGAMGQIVCISVAIDNNEPINMCASDLSEKGEYDLIYSFYDFLILNYNPSSQQRPVFVGHNILGFDLRFLFQRSVMLGIKPPLFVPFKAKPWDDIVFDTMTAWAGVGNRVSLAKLCKVFGLDAKGSEVGDEIDGSKVWDFVKSGRIEDVATYCMGDVERTRAIHKRLTFSE
jgi:predicted PolB exonuclease-like 3'-5' exonuclease